MSTSINSNIINPDIASSHTDDSDIANPCISQHSGTSLRQRREQLLELAQDSVEKNSVDLLRILGSGNWNELLALCDVLEPFLPSVPSSLTKEWHVQKLLHFNKKYEDFTPASIGNRVCLTTTEDGNCIFNAFAITLYGDEKNAFLLRLSTVVKMAGKILEYSKYDVVKDKKPVLRGYIYRNAGFAMMRRSLRIGRFGPFQEEIVDSLVQELRNYTPLNEQSLVLDVYLSEVLLCIVEKREGVNRLLAEKVLLDY